MAMASNTESETQIRKEFETLRQFSDSLSASSAFNFEPGVLSFGMSSDYKIALDCGSNMLRIGSTIFGHRNYSV